MRVLLVPEIYRRDDLSANGTVEDAIAWVGHWLERDPSLHVYWLLPPRETANYEGADVHSDYDRVTLLEAEPYGASSEPTAMFTEGGYSEAELQAIKRGIHEPCAYVDAVVDGRRVGRRTLVKWLLDPVDQWAARVRPFDVIANVHDLQIPRKFRYCSYRNQYQGQIELCEAVFADGIWFTAPVDARMFREHAGDILQDDILTAALDQSLEIGSPLPFDRFNERYADQPQWLHIAGSLWEKKHIDTIFDIAETLYNRFDVRTLLTSVEEIPSKYTTLEWIEAHPNADRAIYEQSLERGDLAICASEYETLARTWFEQAASGQVLLLRDEPWVYDCVPDHHPLLVSFENLESLAVRTIEGWDEAVEANRELVAHLKRVRAPERVGERTYRDLHRRVAAKTDQYVPEREKTKSSGGVVRHDERGVVSLVAAVSDEIDGDRIELDAVLERVAESEGRDGSRAFGPIADIDVIHALRALGWRDIGDPGTPTYKR